MLSNREIELAQKLKEHTRQQKKLQQEQAQEIAADFGISVFQAQFLLELAAQNSPELNSYIQGKVKR